MEENNHNIFSPDIIKKIILTSQSGKKFEINENDIYYDSNIDITSQIDNITENIKDVIIHNHFGGVMNVKNILNIQGSGETRIMLKNNIEKLFSIPFFKLFEIFYSTINDKKKYKELKEKNFGSDFQDLKILKPFQKQIQTLNELLLFSRPDILASSEKEFLLEYNFVIKQYIEENRKKRKYNGFTDEQLKYINAPYSYINKKLEILYKQAKKIQEEQEINCVDSQQDSIAQKVSFPKKMNGKIKKLFMCKREYFNIFRNDNIENNNFILQKFDDMY